MYQILCDGYPLLDLRDDDLIVFDPKVKLAVNSVGEGSFTIYPNHPYFHTLKKLKSVFTVLQDGQTIFKGRMTEDSRAFLNYLDVDLEGVLAYTNDTLIPPFRYPEDFNVDNVENVVENLLSWFIQKHNEQVQDWQKLKLGVVTVTDPNNVITRSSDKYLSTWDCLKGKLFESQLGGKLCVRYESDGTYIDYLESFPLTNTQKITFGENLLDMVTVSDATETYSAILPMGATFEPEEGDEWEKYTLDLSSLPDGDLDDDLVKQGLYIWSRSAVEAYGWRCMPVDESTWSDVKLVSNLKTKAIEKLTGDAVKLSNTITVKAVDLGFTDDEISGFRVYRNVLVDAPLHGAENALYELTELDIDLLHPQDTVITVGDTQRSLIDINRKEYADTIERIEAAGQLVEGVQQGVNVIRNQLLTLETSVASTCEAIVLGALQEYSETGDLAQFKQSVQAQLAIMATNITMNFSSVSERIENVNGDLQKRFEKQSKYIRFSQDGIEIGKDENSLKLTLDNDKIKFTRNGVPVGWWDGSDFHTGNMVVEVNERAQFGDFAFVPRSDGSLMFLKVGG